MPDLKKLIKFYFALGMKQHEIRMFLKFQHDFEISARHLKRILKANNLRRRHGYSSADEIVRFIRRQLETSSQLHGYRWMHLKCLQHGLVVRQNTIRLLLKELDPEGVSLRRRRRLKRRQYSNKGPNYLWHIDGYDKLKPYGIAISGCIDGYSRHIIWLKACYTNNNPRIISGFFLSSVETCGGCPRSVRTDMGTENCHIEHMQTFLRSRFFRNQNSLPAYISGTSQHNQRIESFWSILRKENAQYWMNLFETLKDENYFNGTFVDKSLIQICFLHLIQIELDEVSLVWNNHRIARHRKSRSPSGKPIIMYNLPELFGTKNYIVKVSDEELTIFKEQSTFLEENMCCDNNVYNLCKILMVENNYEKPETTDEALILYKNIRSKLYALLD